MKTVFLLPLTGALLSTLFSQVHAALVVTDLSSAPIVVSSAFTGTEINLNPGTEPTGDSTNDISIQIVDFGPGGVLNASGAAGTLTTVVVLGPTTPDNETAEQLGLGDMVSFSNSFSATSGAFGAGLLASEASATGEWAGGATGFVGFSFQIAGATHFGFAEVTWNPDDPLDTSVPGSSTAVITQVGYETVPGQTLNLVPEPATAFLTTLASLIIGLRRRRS